MNVRPPVHTSFTVKYSCTPHNFLTTEKFLKIIWHKSAPLSHDAQIEVAIPNVKVTLKVFMFKFEKEIIEQLKQKKIDTCIYYLPFGGNSGMAVFILFPILKYFKLKILISYFQFTN